MFLARPVITALLLLTSLLASGQAFAQAAPTRFVRTLARGITLIQEITPDNNVAGPLVVNVVQIDPKAKGVRVEAALGQDRVWGSDPTFGREIVSTLAARHKAVAAMNASFFPFMGNPIGLHRQGGDIVTEPADQRTCFLVMKDGTAKIAAFDYSGKATLLEKGETKAIEGLNRKPGKDDELLLFTPIFFDATLRTPGRVEAILTGISDSIKPGKDYVGKVAQVTEGGGTTIAPGTVVLSAGGADANFMRSALPGTKIAFRLETNVLRGDDVKIADIREAVAGAPRLLTDGKVTITLKEEHIGESFSTTRHPRSAVGIDKDGKILLMSVDGRQKNLSRGASLPELAALLLKFGAVNAVNMDGGGSTALVALDAVINSPSEGRERPIASALLVYGDRPKEKKEKPVAEAMNVRVGEVRALSPTKMDEKTLWGTAGGVGFVTQEGEFRALRPGSGIVYKVRDGRRTAFPVVVRGADVGDAPGFMATLTWESVTPASATLQIRIANAEGDRLGQEPIRLTVTGGTAESETITTDTRGEATLMIRWNAPADKERSVTIASPRNRFATTKKIL